MDLNISAAIKVLLIFGYCTDPAQAEYRLFSSGGGMGVYYNAFILSTKAAGIGDHYIAAIRLVDNSGEVSDSDWVVNCNEGYPQVLRPTGENVEISLSEAPPSATRTSNDLWWAVCKNEYQRFSRGESDTYPLRLKLGATGQLPLASGSSFGYQMLPLGDAAVMQGLAKLLVTDSGRAEPAEVFVYCSRYVPTVYWPGRMIELTIADDDGRYERDTVFRSRSIYTAVCNEKE